MLNIFILYIIEKNINSLNIYFLTNVKKEILIQK